MAFVLAHRRINDYATWQAVFDDTLDLRRSSGEKSHTIFQIDGDPNNLVVLFEWDNLDNAHLFFNSPELKKLMQKAGVVEDLGVHFLHEVTQQEVIA